MVTNQQDNGAEAYEVDGLIKHGKHSRQMRGLGEERTTNLVHEHDRINDLFDVILSF